MLYSFLPLLLISAVICLSLATRSGVTQSKPDQFRLETFNPIAPRATEPDATLTLTPIGLNDNSSLGIRGTGQPVDAPAAASSMRISQIHSRGGEAGATYLNDYVEIFNAGNTTVDINGWGLVVNSLEGSTPQIFGVRYNTSFQVTPGMHLLVRFAGNGSNGQQLTGLLPTVNDISLGSHVGGHPVWAD